MGMGNKKADIRMGYRNQRIGFFVLFSLARLDKMEVIPAQLRQWCLQGKYLHREVLWVSRRRDERAESMGIAGFMKMCMCASAFAHILNL